MDRVDPSRQSVHVVVVAAGWLVGLACVAVALAVAAEPPNSTAPTVDGGKSAAEQPPGGDPPGWRRMTPEGGVWIDTVGKQVVVDGEVIRRTGELELFACLKHTKEHESIVSVDQKAQVIHAALLAVGADAGSPVQFLPKYVPATGSEVEIHVEWTDDQDKPHRANARDWLLNTQTQKPLTTNWVFGGSGFWTDPMTGARYYLAEDGDLICVSNFPSAMLDLPIESSQSNEALLFEANTEKIPEPGTKLKLFLKPKPRAKPAANEPD